MCSIDYEYFSELFAGNFIEEEIVHMRSPKRVTEDQNVQLVKELMYGEFTLAIKQMHPDKASGPDGLNPAFFQTYWSKMGREVFSCCKHWLETNSFPHELNSTNVALIPKKENAV